jgi:hypothetical protein
VKSAQKASSHHGADSKRHQAPAAKPRQHFEELALGKGDATTNVANAMVMQASE